MNVGHDTQTIEWKAFQQTVLKWFHRPDWLVCRAVLATAKALEIETTPVWLMVIGPSSCGKSEFYVYLLHAVENAQWTSDMNVPALISISSNSRGQGILRRIGDKGLWAITDFSSILNQHEETRAKVLAASREIFDGEYHRDGGGVNEVWQGRVHVVAACTPALERHFRVYADLGERFIQVQLDRVESPNRELRRKVNLQRQNKTQYHTEIVDRAKTLLDCPITHCTIPDSIDETISVWAEITALCRTTVSRNAYNGDIMDTGYTEGSSRIAQQYLGLAHGDAAILRQNAIGAHQLDLIERVAIDSLPRSRRGIIRFLSQWPVDQEVRRGDLQDESGITHNESFRRVLEDLTALNLIETVISESQTNIRCKGQLKKLLTLIQSTRS